MAGLQQIAYSSIETIRSLVCDLKRSAIPSLLRGTSELNRERHVVRDDLERIRSELSRELNEMSPRQRKKYLEAADQVYDGLEKMAKIRPIKA